MAEMPQIPANCFMQSICCRMSSFTKPSCTAGSAERFLRGLKRAQLSEYLQATYPDASGFSPRNLRRIQNFYHCYEYDPAPPAEVMRVGWTQNVLILEHCASMAERIWYSQRQSYRLLSSAMGILLS